MDDLKKQADELGIEVDGRWGEERLRQEIDAALSGPKPEAKPAERMVAVRILRDFWGADGERHSKGQVIEVTVDEALTGIESAALARVKG